MVATTPGFPRLGQCYPACHQRPRRSRWFGDQVTAATRQTGSLVTVWPADSEIAARIDARLGGALFADQALARASPPGLVRGRWLAALPRSACRVLAAP